MVMAQFEEVRDSSNNLIKLKAKLTEKREINVTKAGDYVYLHVNNLDGAYERCKKSYHKYGGCVSLERSSGRYRRKGG